MSKFSHDTFPYKNSALNVLTVIFMIGIISNEEENQGNHKKQTNRNSAS
jgi:hypothetical protein